MRSTTRCWRVARRARPAWCRRPKSPARRRYATLASVGTLAVAVRNDLLNAIARGVAYANAETWVKLHIGDPGAAGTANPAANTTRMQVTCGTAAASGSIASTVAVEWTSVIATETYTHVSLWSGELSGTLIGTDELSAPAPIAAGGDFTIPIGDLELQVA
jgi:hypothetical protein